MCVGTGVEGFTPDVVDDDSIEYVDAIIAMDQVDISVRVFDRLATPKKTARVTTATDQSGKADNGRTKLLALPEQVFDDDQRMIRRFLARRFRNDFAASRIHRRRAHEQNRLDPGCFNFPHQPFESIDIPGSDVDDQRVRLQKRIDIIQGFTDIDDAGFAWQCSELRQAIRGSGRYF